MENIGQRIKQLRKEKNISQATAAKQIGVSTGNLGDWETQKSKPGANALVALAKYFEVNLEWLLTGEYNNNNQFTKEETEFISRIRELDTRDKEELNNIVNYKYKKMLDRR